LEKETPVAKVQPIQARKRKKKKRSKWQSGLQAFYLFLLLDFFDALPETLLVTLDAREGVAEADLRPVDLTLSRALFCSGC
jgi:hypothetical protein